MLFILSESRAFCTFFAPRVSKIQVVAKMYKMHTIQNKGRESAPFAPSSLLVYQKYKSSQKCTKCTRFGIRGRESAPFAPFSLFNSTNEKQNQT